MIKKNGFTLLEVLISLSIFAYVFSSLMVLFFQFSNNTTSSEKCSSFTFIIIQKLLTENDRMDVSEGNDKVTLNAQTLLAEPGALYLFKNIDIESFNLDKSSFQLDSCSITFQKNTTTTKPLINSSKCIDFQYKHGATKTVCGLK